MRDILERLVRSEISVDEAEKLIRINAVDEVANCAKLDVSREARRGVPEIVLAEGKAIDDLKRITLSMLKNVGRVILSRVDADQVSEIRKTLPAGCVFSYNERARIVVVKGGSFESKRSGGRIGILSAGTSDIPVCEEARIVAEEMGCDVYEECDVGVAGIQRLFPALKKIIERDVDVVIVAAGREGALPSVVSGFIEVPIIGVPVGVGYGLGGDGVGALLSMLQSCSLGIAVVNIDSGVAAGTVAALIANRVAKVRKRAVEG